MSFFTAANRIYVTDSSNNIKFDTDKKYPYVIGTLEGSVTFSNNINVSYEDVYYPPVGETPGGTGTEIRHYGTEIDQTAVLHSASYPINFCFSSVIATSYSYVDGVPGNYFYYKLPLNQAFSTNGSLLTELSVMQNGTVARVAELSVYANASNQVVFYYKRTGAFQNGQTEPATISFYYRVRYGRII